MTRYVLAGNSVAAISAVEAIRNRDKNGLITIISPEPYDAYSRPAITYFIADKISWANMRYRPKNFYDKNRITLIRGRAVSALDTDRSRVILDDDIKISFDKLLLATGGEPLRPPIRGINRKNVFTCMSFDDAKAIKAAVRPNMKAVIIGGGLIGIKAAEALRICGLQVTIVELLDRILAPILDHASAKVVERFLAEQGIRTITGAAASELIGASPESSVKSVVLDNGHELPADIVILAAGVKPRIGYIGETLKTNRGIIVNDKMRTSKPGIYAAGDVTETLNIMTGQSQLTPLWPIAYREGRAAGLNMAGIKSSYDGNISMNSVPVLGLPVISLGIFDSKSMPGLKEIDFIDPQLNIYRKLILKDDVIKGAVFIGAIERSGVALALMRAGTRIGKDARVLLDPNFSWMDFNENIRLSHISDLKG